MVLALIPFKIPIIDNPYSSHVHVAVMSMFRRQPRNMYKVYEELAFVTSKGLWNLRSSIILTCRHVISKVISELELHDKQSFTATLIRSHYIYIARNKVTRQINQCLTNYLTNLT
jgi:hypothetical protein